MRISIRPRKRKKPPVLIRLLPSNETWRDRCGQEPVAGRCHTTTSNSPGADNGARLRSPRTSSARFLTPFQFTARSGNTLRFWPIYRLTHAKNSNLLQYDYKWLIRLKFSARAITPRSPNRPHFDDNSAQILHNRTGPQCLTNTTTTPNYEYKSPSRRP